MPSGISFTNETSYIPSDIVKRSRRSYNQNNFTAWLNSVVGHPMASKAISQYHIGTSKHWPGAAIFWQIDQQGKVHTGKIMLYDKSSGRRVKHPYPHITWVHKVCSISSFNLQQCFFGEHLLKGESNRPVGVAESEKTAIIASIYLPHFVWLAAGSLSNLTIPKFEILKGRKIFFFPDHKGYQKWTEKANEIRLGIPGIHIIVSNLLERVHWPNKEPGFDLADYLIQYKCHDFASVNKPNQESTELVLSIAPISSMTFQPTTLPKELPAQVQKPFQTDEPEVWPVNELEMFFKETRLPKGPVNLDCASTIIDIHKFINSNLETIKAQNGNPTFRPYFERLNHLKEHILLFHNLAPKPLKLPLNIE